MDDNGILILPRVAPGNGVLHGAVAVPGFCTSGSSGSDPPQPTTTTSWNPDGIEYASPESLPATATHAPGPGQDYLEAAATGQVPPLVPEGSGRTLFDPRVLDRG